jgi:hypothetical protein
VTDFAAAVQASRRSLPRRVAGAVLIALAVLTLLLYVLGTWNPGDHVVLARYFGNPLVGAVVFFALAFVALWLLAPVRNEAAQGRRLALRVTCGILLVAAVIAWLLFGPIFAAEYATAATSPSGQRTIAMVDPGTDDQRLRVWVGRGLGARDVGGLGRPCGMTTVSFRGEDTVHVSTSYGEFDLRLDPATGRPLQTLGPTCAG